MSIITVKYTCDIVKIIHIISQKLHPITMCHIKPSNCIAYLCTEENQSAELILRGFPLFYCLKLHYWINLSRFMLYFMPFSNVWIIICSHATWVKTDFPKCTKTRLGQLCTLYRSYTWIMFTMINTNILFATSSPKPWYWGVYDKAIL